MTQPPFSGAPVPVPGVTGGPPVLGGQIGNDPNDGSVVISPNPGQVLQVRKGNNPTALQVYEYFHTSTDYSRIALNSQTNGPFQLAVETAPTSVIRELDINANGVIRITGGGNVFVTSTGAVLILGASGQVQFAPNNAVAVVVQNNGILPQVDAAVQLGAGTNRFTSLTLSGQVITGDVAPGATSNGGISFDPAGGLNLTHPNLTAATAGAAAGVFLKINISGAPYKLQLLAV